MKDKIFAICEQLKAEGVKVTQGSVRDALGSGSFSTIAPIIREWRDNTSPDEVTQEIPATVQAAANQAAVLIWKAANNQCNESIKAIRHEAEQLTEQATIERDEALNEVKRLEAENDRVTAKATEQANELNELRIKLRLAEATSDKAEEATKALRTELDSAQKNSAKLEGMLTVYESIGKPAEAEPTKTPTRKTKQA
jgi:chromosome segregation ATPase